MLTKLLIRYCFKRIGLGRRGGVAAVGQSTVTDSSSCCRPLLAEVCTTAYNLLFLFLNDGSFKVTTP